LGALLDALLQIDRSLEEATAPLEPVRRSTKPSLTLVKNNGQLLLVAAFPAFVASGLESS